MLQKSHVILLNKNIKLKEKYYIILVSSDKVVDFTNEPSM